MPESLKQLINAINYLPGIGENRATKLAFFLLNANRNYIENLSENLKNIKDKIGFCKNCNSLCDIGQDLCKICESNNRNKNIIAIVEEYLDMLTIEETGGFRGVYHVLGGAISPINGVFIGDLKFEELFKRIIESDENVEIILATNPNIEGEATSNYISEEIEKRKLKYKTKITRLSRGLSSGYIEYADNITLVNALKERKEI
ncbi:MAG: recombination mediator RecR [Candidatus Gracilibacteria bacterium]|nr:recombination mediator RecR [Candidatus Gracilibacteria bacterium]